MQAVRDGRGLPRLRRGRKPTPPPLPPTSPPRLSHRYPSPSTTSSPSSHPLPLPSSSLTLTPSNPSHTYTQPTHQLRGRLTSPPTPPHAEGRGTAHRPPTGSEGRVMPQGRCRVRVRRAAPRVRRPRVRRAAPATDYRPHQSPHRPRPHHRRPGRAHRSAHAQPRPSLTAWRGHRPSLAGRRRLAAPAPLPRSLPLHRLHPPRLHPPRLPPSPSTSPPPSPPPTASPLSRHPSAPSSPSSPSPTSCAASAAPSPTPASPAPTAPPPATAPASSPASRPSSPASRPEVWGGEGRYGSTPKHRGGGRGPGRRRRRARQRGHGDGGHGAAPPFPRSLLRPARRAQGARGVGAEGASEGAVDRRTRPPHVRPHQAAARVHLRPHGSLRRD